MTISQVLSQGSQVSISPRGGRRERGGMSKCAQELLACLRFTSWRVPVKGVLWTY